MALSLLAKLFITGLSLGVLAGMTVTIYFVVTDEGPNYGEITTTEEIPSTSEAPIPTELLYEVGVGIADMTGPCVEITFMGYAELSQSGVGIHTRQFARSFIFEKDGKRIVLVTADVQSIGIAVRREVVKNLQALYGDLYTLQNVILTGTHTHSAPGGYLVDFILDVSILGFSRETFDAYVTGLTNSIVRAHENMVPARLFYSTSTVPNAHMNRSPYSYQYNPSEERERYESDTDDVLTQVRIVKEDGTLHGIMNWFAVHTTCMNMTNLLISSDNLGYASIKMEAMLNPETFVGQAKIVAGFFASNLGDVSPNLRGARCEFSGDECDNQFLLCAAGERCYSLGPGDDMFESTRIIGTAVYEGAVEALNTAGQELRGELNVVHQFLDMAEQVVSKYDPVERIFNENEQVTGCRAALGYSFASGTIDGANTLNITQGTIQGNPLLDAIGDFVAQATEEDVECHDPKPILLMTGRADFPIPWHPSIVSATVVYLGGLAIAGVPGEPTTMSGRRIRDVVGAAMERQGLQRRVVVSGLTNEYIHYVATPEEYQVQRYEAASTIYGPNTLDIFLNKFDEFTTVAIQGGTVEPGPEPADNLDRTISLILPVVVDNAPSGSSFGDVVEQPPATVARGGTISATFVAGNPRNNLRQGSSHALNNNLIGEKQIKNLLKIAEFSKNKDLKETSQAEIREECLRLWKLPDKLRTQTERLSPEATLKSILDSMKNRPKEAHSPHAFKSAVLSKPPHFLEEATDLDTFKNVYDWHFYFLSNGKNSPDLKFFIGCGGKQVHQLEGTGWKSVIDLHLTLPAKTLLYGEIVKEYRGLGNNQMFSKALHVIDALVLGGTDISHLPLSERIHQCNLFCSALDKPYDKSNALPIRCKRLFNMEDFPSVVNNLECRAMKRVRRALTMNIPDRITNMEMFHVVGSVLFVKEMREPWQAHISKKCGRKYYYGIGKDKKPLSLFHIIEEAGLDLVEAYTQRVMWNWEEAACAIFEGLPHKGVTRAQMEGFIEHKTKR